MPCLKVEEPAAALPAFNAIHSAKLNFQRFHAPCITFKEVTPLCAPADRAQNAPVFDHKLEGLAVQAASQIKSEGHIQLVLAHINLVLVHRKGPNMLRGDTPVPPFIGVPEELLSLGRRQWRPWCTASISQPQHDDCKN